MANAASVDTKEQILNVAEQLIAEYGYAGTTVRNIVNKAGVNLAAVHYHFGSKEDLFRAVFSRIAHPIVEDQLALLTKLRDQSPSPAVEAILTAFLTPPIEHLIQNESFRMVRAQFMGRCWTEPEPVQSIAYQEFKLSRDNYLDAFQRALPDQSRLELEWKLDMVIAAMIRVKTEAGKPNALLKSNRTEDVKNTIEKLVRFLAPGMQT